MNDPKATAETFTRALLDRLGPRLHSALLYGSVARGEAVLGVSDINLMVLLDRIDAEALRLTSPLARRWAQAGNTAPLLMAEEEWRRAADAFAIELSDMRDAHLILHGRDPLEELAVDPSDLRLQVEREIRGKLVQFREGMLIAGEDEEAIGRLLSVALPSFITYLRSTLRLVGRRVPDTSPDVVREAGQVIGVDPEPLLRVWDARTRRQTIRATLDDPVVGGYYELAERTAAFVDSLQNTRTQ